MKKHTWKYLIGTSLMTMMFLWWPQSSPAMTLGQQWPEDGLYDGGYYYENYHDDFYYSRSLRRFHPVGGSFGFGWGYFDPWFTNDVYFVIGTPYWHSWNAWFSPWQPAVTFYDPFWPQFTPTWVCGAGWNPWGFSAGIWFNPWNNWHRPNRWAFQRGFNNGYAWGYQHGFNDGLQRGLRVPPTYRQRDYWYDRRYGRSADNRPRQASDYRRPSTRTRNNREVRQASDYIVNRSVRTTNGRPTSVNRSASTPQRPVRSTQPSRQTNTVRGNERPATYSRSATPSRTQTSTRSYEARSSNSNRVVVPSRNRSEVRRSTPAPANSRIAPSRSSRTKVRRSTPTPSRSRSYQAPSRSRNQSVSPSRSNSTRSYRSPSRSRQPRIRQAPSRSSRSSYRAPSRSSRSPASRSTRSVRPR